MKIGQRLLLGVLPALLGVFAVIGLAYWGRYDREAPRLLVVIAVVAATLSLLLAWRNARYVRDRIEELAAQAAGADPRAAARDRDVDEIETIASTVAGLTEAVEWARDEGDRRAQRAEAREHEYAGIVEQLTQALGARIQDASLPLHVLLASPFGALNENQEEMLGTAQAALDTADQEVRRLRSLLALDRGERIAAPRPMRADDLLKPALAVAQARASTTHVTLHVDVPDTVPRLVVDPQQAQAALSEILVDAVTRAAAGSDVRVTVRDGARDHVQIVIAHPAAEREGPPSLEQRLAARFIAAQAGTIVESSRGTVVELPAERVMPA